MAFVVKPHRPRRAALLRLLMAVLWLASMGGAYYYGRVDLERQLYAKTTENESLYRRVGEATETNREQTAQMAILERTAQIDHAAKAQVLEQLKAERGQNAELQERVSFYESIISPDEGKSGLGIYSFEVTQAAQELYHFKMVLIQAGKNANLARGRANIAVEGILDGRGKRLELSEIQVPGGKAPDYNFRYFQEITGSIRLPRGFVPREVVVTLVNNRGRGKAPVKQYDWSEIKV